MVKYATGTSDKAKVKKAAAAAKRKKATAAAQPKAKKPEPLPGLSEKQERVLRALRAAEAEVETIAATFSVDIETAKRMIERQALADKRAMKKSLDAAVEADAGTDDEDDDFDPTMVGGRPSVWHPSYVTIGKQLAGLGATDLEISQAFDVSVRTIHRWKIEHPAFRDALKQGKETIDDKVEESLLKRATGYTFDSEKVLVVDKELQRVQTIEHVPPDPRAAMFWLQNRRPGLWRATQHIKHDIPEDSPLATFLSEVSGKAFQPVDQDGPVLNEADEQPLAFAPLSDEQETEQDDTV